MKTASKKIKTIFIGGVLLLAAAILFTVWGNTTVGTTRFTISSPKIPAAFKGYRIAQISDLHNANFGGNNAKIINILKKENPDIIAITGDMIDSNHTDIAVAVDFVKEALKIAPCYYVTGNHEAWLGRKYNEFEQILIDCGVTVLHNQKAQLIRNGTALTIAGIDDPDYASSESGMFDLTEAVICKEIDALGFEECYNILLSHRPEVFEVYAEKGIDLVLSGHAHGGQFRLPFIGGLAAPNQGFFPKYDGGLYEKDITSMIVSRGLGNSIIPIRFNNRPEVIIIELD